MFLSESAIELDDDESDFEMLFLFFFRGQLVHRLAVQMTFLYQLKISYMTVINSTVFRFV